LIDPLLNARTWAYASTGAYPLLFRQERVFRVRLLKMPKRDADEVALPELRGRPAQDKLQAETLYLPCKQRGEVALNYLDHRYGPFEDDRAVEVLNEENR